MKFTNPILSTVKVLLVTGTVALPGLSHASDWIADPGTPGLFGVDANWDPSGVPSGTTANILNGGTAQVIAGDSFGVTGLNLGGHSGSGSLTQGGGTLAVGQVVVGGDDNLGGTGTGTLTMTGGEILGTSGQEWWVGSRGGAGTLTMSGNSTLENSNWVIFGRDTDGAATVTLSGSAHVNQTSAGNLAIAVNSGATSTVTMSNSSEMNAAGDVRVGWLGASSGVLTMHDAAKVTATGWFVVGQETAGGNSSVTMDGTSSVTAGGELRVGHMGGDTNHAALTMNGNSTATSVGNFWAGFQSTGNIILNDQASASGAIVVAGGGAGGNGTITVNGSASLTANNTLLVAWDNSTGTFTQNGGTVNAIAGGFDPIGASVMVNGAGGNNGVVNLNGGTLLTTGFHKAGGAATVNFNGGTVKATGVPTGDFFNGFADGELVLQQGGMKIDSNGNSFAIVQALTGAGGLTKQGVGTVTLSVANTYLGDTRVEAGTLSLFGAGLADASNVFLTTGAFFDLSTSGATDTINALVIDGVPQAVGTWGAVGSGAQFTSALITGDGFLNVTSTAVPEPSTVVLILGGLVMLVIFRRRSTTSPS